MHSPLFPLTRFSLKDRMWYEWKWIRARLTSWYQYVPLGVQASCSYKVDTQTGCGASDEASLAANHTCFGSVAKLAKR